MNKCVIKGFYEQVPGMIEIYNNSRLFPNYTDLVPNNSY